MADEFDLVIRNGSVVTAADRFDADVGVRAGRIAALGERLGKGEREIDARGKLVLPGGVDSHCHIEQLSAFGVMTADDFYTGTVSAAYGGTTTVIPFAAQQRGQSVRKVVEDYRACAQKAVIDHAFHMIVSDPSPEVLQSELPALIAEGFSSIKLFMTYDAIRVTDEQMLDVLALARTQGAMVVVHAENHGMIHWLAQRLLDKGYTAPKYHAVSHVRLAETEAVSRAIQLAAMIDQPLTIFHISTEGSMDAVRAAQTRGQKVYGETCPQYLFLTADDLDKPGVEGAMWCCSPPPRDHGRPGSDVARPGQRHVSGLFLGPRALQLRRARQARQGREPGLQEHRERPARPGAAHAVVVLGGRLEGPDRHPPLRRSLLRRRGQALRAASEEGHRCHRVGRRPRDLGSRQVEENRSRHHP